MTIHTFRAPLRRNSIKSGYASYDGASLSAGTTTSAQDQEAFLYEGEKSLDLLSGLNVHANQDAAAHGSAPHPTEVQRSTKQPSAASSSVLLSPAEQPDAGLCSQLQHLAGSVVARSARSIVAEDPILGSFSKITSVGSRLQKHHGYHLPAALAMVLSQHGLEVWLHPRISLPQSFLDLGEDNTIETLQSLNVKPTGLDRREYITDLIVYCPKSGWTAAFDGKRGGGSSDTTAKDDLIPKLKATLLMLPHWAREKRLQPTVTDVRVIDFYGCSGFPDTIAVRGWDLDDYFGCAVEYYLAYFTACFRIAAAKLMAIDGLTSVKANPDPHTLVDQVKPICPQFAADLFTPAEGRHASILRFADSRAQALARLNAKAAA